MFSERSSNPFDGLDTGPLYSSLHFKTHDESIAVGQTDSKWWPLLQMSLL